MSSGSHNNKSNGKAISIHSNYELIETNKKL